MKFFHLSDLHIGLKLIERDLREDQEYIFEQIIRLAKEQQPDAMVIAGDIYDKAVPSAEAVEIFDSFMKNLSEEMPQMPVMIISGNHDSAARLNCFRSILSRQNVYMIGTPPTTEEEHIEKVTLQDAYGDLHFYLLPFVKPSMVREIVGTREDTAFLRRGTASSDRKRKYRYKGAKCAGQPSVLSSVRPTGRGRRTHGFRDPHGRKYR